ncbi:MAG: ATP-binding cassette domain-containing protein [Acidimicrobiaceae bacterium]|nr:ATP-binding cassette domain-containing protein [Acidimicrobiaceae bacterium]
MSFDVKTGELVGLLGPNGAGKTTTINVLSTLLIPDSGRAWVGGHDVLTAPRAVREIISLTGQFAALDDMLTGRENLVLFGRLRSLSKAAAASRADELLARFGLADFASKRAGTYSGGMRRRLDLAVSLVVPTPVLFLDEPTAGLDPRSRAELWNVVRELRADGHAIVLTTQYLEEADQLADRIVVIDQGRVAAEGTPAELKKRSGGYACVVSPVELSRLDECATAMKSFGAPAVDREAGSVTIADAEPDALSQIIASLHGIKLADISLRQPTLDEVFLQLTGNSPQ